ncbi:MAG: 4-alpha-glucanotransferase, partial [Burkholderiales bacterium]
MAESYQDVWGREKRIDPETRAALARALGSERKPAKVKLEPGRCYQPELLAQGGRVWGFMVQLYGVRSKKNWGIGDFGDLKTLVELAAARGAAVVGVNPLHATQGSPYSPSSRLALNVVYLDVEALPEYANSAAAQRLVKTKAFQRKLEQLRRAPLVDYAGVTLLKLHALRLAFRDAKPALGAPSMFAIFEALREKYRGGWEKWPREYRDPGSRAVQRFARENAGRVAFHEWLQRAARGQLDRVQRRAHELGMPIGLYVDLALGADRGGAEVWADQDAYALDVTCGAPPDEFNPKGQDWGLPPYSPRALAADGYRSFRRLLRANMPEGGAIRMDHVMALSRLYCIPRGASPDRGGYIHYPADDLLAVLAEESRARRCLVIGEDLGTVSAELRTKLHQTGLLSYRPLLFEKTSEGEIAPPPAFPRDALVCVSTHDLPTWKGYWAEHDLGWRDRVGLTVDREKERSMRRDELARLERALAREGLDRSARSAHFYIARTPCKLALVQPEDMLELLEQPNLPGTVDEHPNWRRRLPLALEAWPSDAHVLATVEAMAERAIARGRPQRVPDATYRLQFHKGFRFSDALELVPYLARL